MSSTTTVSSPSLSPLRVRDIEGAYRRAVKSRQPMAIAELRQLEGQRSLLDDVAMSPPNRQVTSINSAPATRKAWVRRRWQDAQTAAESWQKELGRTAAAAGRRLTRLEDPWFTPHLDHPLRLSGCYLRHASVACFSAFLGGMAGAIAQLSPSQRPILGLLGNTAFSFQMYVACAWARCCHNGVDDAHSEFAGLARVAENEAAARQFATLQMALKAQYGEFTFHATLLAQQVGMAAGALVVGGLMTASFATALPSGGTMLAAAVLYGICYGLQTYYLPKLMVWAQKQRNICTSQNFDVLPVLASGLPEDYLALRRRQEPEKVERLFRDNCCNLFTGVLTFAQAALFAQIFGYSFGPLTLLGNSLLQAVAIGSRIGQSMHIIKSTRQDFLKAHVEPSPAKHIKLSRITATHGGERAASVQDVTAAFIANRPGLWILRGANGLGKSSLLRLAKEAVGLQAVYSCAQTPYAAEGQVRQCESTGEAAWERHDALMNNCRLHKKRLLLDEPFASLDAPRAQRVMTDARRLAEERCVVIVAHGGLPGEQPNPSPGPVERRWLSSLVGIQP